MANNAKIMIVEDDTDQLIGLKIRLQANHYTVVHAVDAVAAISTARREQPDLILLDLGLPAGDGFTVMERLHDLMDVAHIPIIIVSAREPETYAERAINAGAFAFFQKPADNAELLEAIEHALGTAV
jgi:DNA-binding response OmpR family regulator